MGKREFWGEFLGTFLMVLFGCGAVAVSVLFNSHQGLFPIAVIWGLSISLGIYATRSLSCAHFNPAEKETLQLRDSIGMADEASLTINARVEMSPADLKTIVMEEINKVCKDGIEVKETALTSLQPGRPNPTYRFDAVVNS